MNNGYRKNNYIPSFIIFDSLDAHIHEDEKKRRDLLYFEYATVHADGVTELTETRNVKTESADIASSSEEEKAFINGEVTIELDAVRFRDHALIRMTDGMKIAFHTMSLPTARLVWHCPFAVLYTSDDGRPGGDNYRELTVLRLDGEGWEEDELAENQVSVSKLNSFTDWNDWKAKNKSGLDCELTYRTEKGKITIETEYCGLSIRSVTTFEDKLPVVYTALTGDQCAITGIRITR